jgi:hypothetical protein
VTIGKLPDSGGLVTVDMSGMIAEWPLTDDHISGLGWFEPKKSMQLPQVFQAPQLWGLSRRRDMPVDKNGDSAENAAGVVLLHLEFRKLRLSCWISTNQ